MDHAVDFDAGREGLAGLLHHFRVIFAVVDDIDIRHLGQQHFRQQVAAVMQQDQLLSGSLAENIAFFDPDIDLEWVQQCAVMAGIHRDITAMPMVYNALIGDMGSSLYGGQRQRLYLARALYKRPKILFLDEATSSLDIQLESHVNQAIKALCITRIIIAHRPETINSADRVLLLCNGKLMDVTEQYQRQRLKDIA